MRESCETFELAEATIQTLQAKNERLTAEARAMREVLREVEFITVRDFVGETFKQCPICNTTEEFVLDSGHDVDCKMGQVLSFTAGAELLERAGKLSNRAP